MHHENMNPKDCGVPLPETCKALNWQNKTKFYWCYLIHPFGVNLYLCLKTLKGYLIVDDENPRLLNCTYLEEIKVYAAPQMHEIAPLLPLHWVLEVININNPNYAEELAKLWISEKYSLNPKQH